MLGLNGTYGTSTGRVRRNSKELRKQQENGVIRDLEREHEEGQGHGLVEKKGACPPGSSPSILDIRVEGCMSLVRGR